MNNMKLKHAVWLLIATYLVTEGNPLLFNGQDLLGYIIFALTFAKIFNPTFSVSKFFISIFII